MQNKKLKLLFIPIVIILLVVLLIEVFPKNIEDSVTINIENDNSKQDDEYKYYTVYAKLEGTSKLNYAEFTLEPTGIEIIDITPLNEFKQYSHNGNTYAFASRKYYENQEKLKIAEIKAKHIDNAEKCYLGMRPSFTFTAPFNVFNIKKEAKDIEGNKITQIEAGEEFIYHITVTGDNKLESDDVTVTDTIPNELEIVEIIDSDNSTQEGQKITWNLGKIPEGTYTKILRVKVRATTSVVQGTITNTATLKVGDTSKNDSATVTVVNSNITITKTASKQQVSNGDSYIYTITVKNTGNGKSKKITVTDNLNENLEFVSSNPTTSSKDGNKLTFELEPLSPNASKTITITVKVKDTNTLTTIPNTATATEEGKPPVSSSVDVNVLTPDLQIEKTASSTEVRRGSTFTYKIVITNKGKGTARNVNVTDTINSKFTATSTSYGTLNGNNLTANYATIKAGESKTITVTCKVNSDADLGEVPNTAKATSDNNKDVSDDEPVTIVDSNISITKTANKNNLKPGEEFTYTITVKNTGTSPTSQLTVKDVLNENLELVDGNGARVNGRTLTWTINSLAVDGTQSYTIKVKVKKTVTTDNLTIPNVASVTETGKDEITDDEDVTVHVPILEITKKAKNLTNNEIDYVNPNETFYYEITVQNTGSIESGPYTVTDTLNSLLSILSTDPDTQVNGQTVTWNIDTLEAGASKTFKITVKVSEDAPLNEVIPNTAILKHNDEEKKANDDVTVIDADVFITKVASTEKVHKGQEFSYLIRFGNYGTDAATDVTITDQLPEKLTLLSIAKPDKVTNNSDGKNLSFHVDNLAPNEVLEITINVKVNDDVVKDEVILNTAVLETEDKRKESSDEVIVEDTDISIKKTTSVTTIVNNQEFSYTITITNDGTISAQDLTLIDTFDERLTIIDPDGGSILNNTITWSIPELGAHSSISKTIKVKITDAENGEIIKNVALVKEPGKPDKDDEVENPVGDVILKIEKSANKTEVKKGEEFTYTINVTNESDFAVSDILVTDEIDSRLEIIEAQDAQVEDHLLSWYLNLDKGETKSLTVKVKVSSTTDVTKIPNIATVTHDNIPKKSNEVIVDVIINNPQTGSITNYIIIITSIASVLSVVAIATKRRKFYRI